MELTVSMKNTKGNIIAPHMQLILMILTDNKRGE